MKLVFLFTAFALSFAVPLSALADEICLANKDTALFADAAMKEEDRMVFQFDGVQFVPERKDAATLFGWAYDVRMQQLLETQSYVRAGDWDCEDYTDFEAITAGAENVSASTIYDVSSEACQQELTDTRMEISAQAFAFYEASCDVADASPQGNATVYTLNCYGAGDTWAIQALLSPSGSNSVDLTVEGSTTHYVTCGE